MLLRLTPYVRRIGKMPGPTCNGSKGMFSMQVSDPTASIETEAEYEGKTKKEKLAPEATTIELRFEDIVLKKPSSVPPWIIYTVAVVSGVVGLITVLILISLAPDPTDHQFFVFRVVIALSAGAFGATIPGFLHLRLPLWRQGLISAGGAIALFVIVYMLNPPTLLTQNTVPSESHMSSGLQQTQ